MHPTAEQGFERMLGVIPPVSMGRGRRVLDVGGADVNGTVHGIVRSLFAVETLDVLDIERGSGVTIVADATDPGTWNALTGSAPYDLVISTETFEHVEAWREIVNGAAVVLRPGGWFVGTCASFGRRPHGARGAHDPAPGEWYANVMPHRLVAELTDYFGGEVVVEYSRRPEFPTTHDLYWRAQKVGS